MDVRPAQGVPGEDIQALDSSVKEGDRGSEELEERVSTTATEVQDLLGLESSLAHRMLLGLLH